jgi:hypothetical protein
MPTDKWNIVRLAVDTDGSEIPRWQKRFDTFLKGLKFMVEAIDDETQEIVADRIKGMQILFADIDECESFQWDGSFPLPASIQGECLEQVLGTLEAMNTAESIAIFLDDDSNFIKFFQMQCFIDISPENGILCTWEPS